MKIKKKYVLSFIVLFCLFSIWYLGIKESDYCISFKVKTSTGTVFQGIPEWTATRFTENKEKYSIIEKRNFDFIKQTMIKGKEKMEYSWNMKSINDSITKVSVGIKDCNYSIYNRLTVPFVNTFFKEEQIKKITNFKSGLQDHLKNFSIRIDGEGTSEKTVVAYVKLKSVLQEKAQTMIQNNGVITGFLAANKIKIVGMPYLEVVSWDLEKETLDFNYCFPIPEDTKIIENDLVKFKTIQPVKGLKATYYGNYRTSDRAWFSLLDYAKKNGYKVINKPLEHFLANPFNGGDESTWEAKIFMPIKQ